MLKFFSILSVFFLMIIALPANADWCQTTGGGVEECGTIPSSWTECGTFGGETVWCWPQTSSSGSSSSKSTTNTLIAIGVGAVFIVTMWYIFKTPQSENNPTQVQLMEF